MHITSAASALSWRVLRTQNGRGGGGFSAGSSMASTLKMATENSPSEDKPPSPSPRGGILPVPVPVNNHGESSFTIPDPRRGFRPRGDPRPRIKQYTQA
jgi:hypothetical protein